MERKFRQNYVVGGVLIDQSKAFSCVRHNILLGKLPAYGVDESFVCYIYSYLLEIMRGNQ